MSLGSVLEQRNATGTPQMAASTYIPQEHSFLSSNITSLVRFTLDFDNFFVRSKQLKNALSASNLLGYLDGSDPCPPARIFGPVINVKTFTLPNPTYYKWVKIDKLLYLKYYIFSHLNYDDDFDSASKLWEYC